MTFGLFLARKVSLIRALLYMIAQCLGAICGVGLVKSFQKAYYNRYGGGANDLKGRCHEAQALCALMWFLFGSFLATTALSLMGLRGGSGGSRPAMSQV